MTILSNSAAVRSWVRSVLTDIKIPKVSGLSEMIVKRSLINELIEYGLTLEISLVKSEENKADELTRVSRKWLAKRICCVNVIVSEENIIDKLPKLHDTHHLGVDQTLHLARTMWGPKVLRKDVEERDCKTMSRVQKS